MATQVVQSLSDHVRSDPAVCGGKPCVSGTRISVADVYVWHELQGSSADDIVDRYPQLTHADVYAALAYFWDHRDSIMADLARGERLVAELKGRHASKLSGVRGG